MARVAAAGGAAPTLELTSSTCPTAASLELDGMWRTMSWDGAQDEAGDKLPHIDGLPVVQVQVQAGEQGKQPLMVVAQQLSSGEVIRTIEGPLDDVSQLLARRTMSGPRLLGPIVDSPGGLSRPRSSPSHRPHDGDAARRPDDRDHRRPALRQPARDDSAVERGDAV